MVINQRVWQSMCRRVLWEDSNLVIDLSVSGSLTNCRSCSLWLGHFSQAPPKNHVPNDLVFKLGSRIHRGIKQRTTLLWNFLFTMFICHIHYYDILSSLFMAIYWCWKCGYISATKNPWYFSMGHRLSTYICSGTLEFLLINLIS